MRVIVSRLSPEYLVSLTSIVRALHYMHFTCFYKLRDALALFSVVIDRMSQMLYIELNLFWTQNFALGIIFHRILNKDEDVACSKFIRSV